MQQKLRRQVRRVVNEYFVGRKRFTIMIILMMRLKIVRNISCRWINDRISLKPNKY